MSKPLHQQQGIPVSVSLVTTMEQAELQKPVFQNKQRIFYIAALAIVIAVVISLLAKLLIGLIDLITNLSFYGNWSFEASTPVGNGLGWWVIFIPAIGGVVVGLMALYGSKAIRGHGIPEAMEQILTNESKIKPSITFLKPISSAVSIGTGGPFGAEGPIIATGGALGSTLGQLLKITINERKVLLAAGATAGMSAIFGSPVAAIFLAIELLLFEFSPRSIIPVALACITGAAGHHFLFEEGPVFPLAQDLAPAGNTALFIYSLMGLAIGALSVGTTKIVYWIEDLFEKLPIHWMWWPAIGGLVVGLMGYFEPRSLGVGYENITHLLSGTMGLQLVLSLCLFKFISWAVALGSGTSGGTLAPLLTIGGAIGALLGMWVQQIYPESEVNIAMAALLGMSAMFAGASRALLTAIVFALETTHQSNAFLPLLATCSAAYIVSFFFMKNTIMTEKISRRGVRTPDSYEPDVLEKMSVMQLVNQQPMVFNEHNTIADLRTWMDANKKTLSSSFLLITDADGAYKGVLDRTVVFHWQQSENQTLASLLQPIDVAVNLNTSLREAMGVMARANILAIPVLDNSEEPSVVGILSNEEIVNAYRKSWKEHEQGHAPISLKRKGLKILLRNRNRWQQRK